MNRRITLLILALGLGLASWDTVVWVWADRPGRGRVETVQTEPGGLTISDDGTPIPPK